MKKSIIAYSNDNFKIIGFPKSGNCIFIDNLMETSTECTAKELYDCCDKIKRQRGLDYEHYRI